jgi:steroid delta-isomerase-like uncharacterized protein
VTTQAEKNKATEAHLFHELYDKRNLDAIDEFIAPDWIDHAMEAFRPGENASREGLKEMTAKGFRAFPDRQTIIEDMIADDDKVVVRFRVTGTHTGEPYMGVPATGKTITNRIIVIDRFREGRIIESWGVFDQFGVMEQMGLVSAAPAS